MTSIKGWLRWWIHEKDVKRIPKAISMIVVACLAVLGMFFMVIGVAMLISSIILLDHRPILISLGGSMMIYGFFAYVPCLLIKTTDSYSTYKKAL